MDKLELEARQLRDEIFEHTISDKSWNDIKDNWIKDIEWLRKNKATKN